MRSDETMEIAAVLMTALSNFNVGMHSDVYEIIFVRTPYDDRYYSTLHFDTSLIDLDLDARSQKCKNQRLLRQFFPKVFNRFGWNLVYC